MKRNGFAVRLMAGALLFALCALLTAAALGASYEKVYGVTLDRIRVRESASLNADVVDNLRADRCVYILSSKTSGGTTFVQVQYRAAEGKLDKGWAALKSGGTEYIDVLSGEEAKARFGVSGGRLPKEAAGTMSAAERSARREGREEAGTASSSSSSGEEDVREAQEGLKALGYYRGEVTGHAGNKTVAALRAFQKAHGLPQSGEADGATRRAIRTALKSGGAKAAETPAPSSSSGTLRLDASGNAVRTLQKNLLALDFYYGELTGHYGEKTARAVRKYQEAHGLPETGEADRALQKQIAADAGRAAKKAEAKATATPKPAASRSRVYTLDWFKAKENGVFTKIGFAAGKTATLRDLSTGKTLQVRVQSSGYHLDVEPLTEKDTKTLCEIYGVSDPKKIGAERRPMTITTAYGYRVICSCYGTPHGTKIVYGNNFPGQFCLHFLNSKTSGSGKVDNGHQAAIRRAAGMVGKDRVIRVTDRDDLPER